MRARIVALAHVLALGSLAVLHAGCSGCAPSSSDDARSTDLTLHGASPAADLAIVVLAPEQSCPALCNFCPSPTLTVHLVTEIAWATAAVAGALPVVRLSITPTEGVPVGGIDPASPVDVVLKEGESIASVAIEMTRDCPVEGPCDTTYDVRVERVDAGLEGSLSVRMSASVDHVSTEDEALTIEIDGDAS